MSKRKTTKKTSSDIRPVYSHSYQWIERLRYLALECIPGDTFEKSNINLANNLVNGCYMYMLPYPIFVHAFDEFDIYIDRKCEGVYDRTSIFAPKKSETEKDWRIRIAKIENLSAYLNSFCGKRLGSIPLNWSFEFEKEIAHLWFLWADSNMRQHGNMNPDWIIPQHLLLRWCYP